MRVDQCGRSRTEGFTGWLGWVGWHRQSGHEPVGCVEVVLGGMIEGQRVWGMRVNQCGRSRTEGFTGCLGWVGWHRQSGREPVGCGEFLLGGIVFPHCGVQLILQLVSFEL